MLENALRGESPCTNLRIGLNQKVVLVIQCEKVIPSKITMKDSTIRAALKENCALIKSFGL